MCLLRSYAHTHARHNLLSWSVAPGGVQIGLAPAPWHCCPNSNTLSCGGPEGRGGGASGGALGLEPRSLPCQQLPLGALDAAGPSALPSRPPILESRAWSWHGGVGGKMMRGAGPSGPGPMRKCLHSFKHPPPRQYPTVSLFFLCQRRQRGKIQARNVTLGGMRNCVRDLKKGKEVCLSSFEIAVLKTE